MTKYWLTQSDVLVCECSRVHIRSGAKGIKIAAFKVATGGYHGALWLYKLRTPSKACLRRRGVTP